MSKRNLIIAFGISAFLLGSGHTYAKQIQKDASVKSAQIVSTQTEETLKQKSKEQQTQFSFTDEAFFTTNGQPDYFANDFLNNPDLFSLLNMTPGELKQNLDTGKSVVEIAASKNIATQDVIEVIAKEQLKRQFEGEEEKKATEEMIEDLKVKVLHVLEYKNN